MSYCVHCGVELDRTASFCPLCHTPVADPRQPVDTDSPKPFPTRRGEVAPVSKVEVGLLITAMLASVAVCCGVLNLFLHAGRAWSLYVIGAAAMLWLWLVPPLLARGMHLLLRLAVGIGAVLLYVYLISVDLDGRTWFLGLAAPLILWGGAVLLVLGWCCWSITAPPSPLSPSSSAAWGSSCWGWSCWWIAGCSTPGRRAGLWWCWWFAWAW